MRSRPARVAVLSAAVALVAPIPVAAAAQRPPLPATTSSSAWAGAASADGVRVGVVVNEFLVVSNIVDAGGPSAQAVVNAFGDSQAYAAYPYPGEIVLTAHGLSQGAAPDYPLIAQSNATHPDSEVTQGPYDLHARSADDTATAVARAAAGGGGVASGTTQSVTSVVHDPATGAVTADAESTLDGISIAGVLDIGRVHSRAHMVSTPGQPVARSFDTEVGDVSVGGQEVGVTDKGLVLAGTDVPLPPDSTANAMLSAAGVTVHYLAGASTGSSLVAPGLSVQVLQNVPGVGETTVSYLFGQAAVTAQSSGASGGEGGAVGGLTGLSPPGGSPGSMTAGAATGASGPPPPAPVGAAGAPGAAPVTAGAPAAPGPGSYRLAAAGGASSASLYVVLAVGAVVMAAAAQLFRILAVRLAWT